jgi:hypothetical protein
MKPKIVINKKESKSFWLSRTVITAILNAILGAAVPGFRDWVAQHPDLYAGIISSIFVVLRYITGVPLSLSFRKS